MSLARRLAVLAGLLAAAAVWSGSALAAPVNVVLPVVVGRAQVGETLAADPGSWTDAPTSYGFQWQRCNAAGGGCGDIPGATGFVHPVSAADAGSTLVVVVTATSAGGSGTATSAPSLVVPTLALGTAHFLVHYQSDPDSKAAITQTQAGDVAALAERAYASELADGYAAPPSDGSHGGDGRIDLYVGNLGQAGLLGYAQPETLAAPAYGYIALNGSEPEALGMQTIAHELFHLVQFGTWLPASASDSWLFEGSAEWMGYRVDGYDTTLLDVGKWDMSLDCRDPGGLYQCDLEDQYKNGGYSRWPFFEYVTERFGPTFVRDVLAQGAGGAGSATSALSAAAAAKGTSLADVFTDWAVANMTGAYAVPGLQSLDVPTYGSLSAGTLASLNAKTKPGAAVVTSGAIPSKTVAVNHLSVRYLAIRRGDDSFPDGPCYEATLRLSVALPSGTGARPYLWWSQRTADGANKEGAKPLSISGDTATISVPWDTCDWGSTQAYLALPNPSTSLDGQNFRVTGTLTVDRSKQATPVLPPDPVTLPGGTVDAPSGEAAPRVQVFGPQLIRIPSGRRVLRVIVSSSGNGSLKASLGSLSLGSSRLRPGGNDLRFRLPSRALRSLRRTASAPMLLTFTPVGRSGATGKRVVRRVAVQTAKPAPKKHAPKKHRRG